MSDHIGRKDKCYTCAYYQPKTFFCENYLRGIETAIFICPYCINKNEDIEAPKEENND